MFCLILGIFIFNCELVKTSWFKYLQARNLHFQEKRLLAQFPFFFPMLPNLWKDTRLGIKPPLLLVCGPLSLAAVFFLFCNVVLCRFRKFSQTLIWLLPETIYDVGQTGRMILLVDSKGWGKSCKPSAELGLQPRCFSVKLSDLFRSARPGHCTGISEVYILRKRVTFTQCW